LLGGDEAQLQLLGRTGRLAEERRALEDEVPGTAPRPRLALSAGCGPGRTGQGRAGAGDSGRRRVGGRSVPAGTVGQVDREGSGEVGVLGGAGLVTGGVTGAGRRLVVVVDPGPEAAGRRGLRWGRLVKPPSVVGVAVG